MSPIFVPIFLSVFLGIILLIVGIILRKKLFILVGSPAAVLLIGWFFVASISPDPSDEFDRIFGSANRRAVSEINTIKPTMMDGHFLSFRISCEDFNHLIRPQLEATTFTNFHLLRGQKLPSGWPKSVQSATSALYKEVDDNKVLVHYDLETESAYASVQYDQW